MKTYWNAWIRNDRSPSSVSVGGPTAAEAISQAIREAVYMQAVNPGAKITIAEVHEECGTCYNTGTILAKGRRKRCPECRGKMPTARLDDIAFLLPESCNNVQIVMQD